MISCSQGLQHVQHIVFIQRLYEMCCKWCNLAGIYSYTKHEGNLLLEYTVRMTEHFLNNSIRIIRKAIPQGFRQAGNKFALRIISSCSNLSLSLVRPKTGKQKIIQRIDFILRRFVIPSPLHTQFLGARAHNFSKNLRATSKC